MTELKAVHERKHVWRNEFLLIISLIVFVGVVYALDAVFKPVFTATGLLLIGIFLALVPAAIWLIFFYLQDRAEPSPKDIYWEYSYLAQSWRLPLGFPSLKTCFAFLTGSMQAPLQQSSAESLL